MSFGKTPLRDGAVRFVLATVVVLFCAAPAPGDIGGCGQSLQPLGPEPFFAAKKEIDCAKCEECSFSTNFCESACDDDVEPQTEFPAGCNPIVHDGEVCLNALEATGCGGYEDYVRDSGRQSPNECRFCPEESQ